MYSIEEEKMYYRLVALAESIRLYVSVFRNKEDITEQMYKIKIIDIEFNLKIIMLSGNLYTFLMERIQEIKQQKDTNYKLILMDICSEILNLINKEIKCH